MKRFVWFVLCVVLLPLPAAAQGLPPAPPEPPTPPPAAPVPVVPAVPRVRVVPPDFPELRRFGNLDQQERMRDLQERMRDMQERAQLKVQDNRFLNDEVKRVAAQAKNIKDEFNWDLKEDLKWDLKYAEDLKFDFQGPVVVGVGPRVGGDDGGAYNNGLSAIQQRQYDRAITMFDRVVAQRGSKADGALYWKAFAQARLVRTEDAIATLATLRKDFPQSRYLGDAKVLETDVRKIAGQKIDPQQLDANDEIKLLAISGIANTDPNQAIPLLEGVLTASNTLTNKKRAIYVLALNEDPRAHQIVLRYAKGAGNPELQAEAIRYLASRRDSPTRNAELKEIYDSTQDIYLRRTVIDAYRSAGDKPALIAIARGRGEPIELRRSAISGLQNLAAPPELWTIYQQETDPELRSQIVSAFGSMGAVEQLAQVVKTEKDPNVRQNAVRRLGNQSTDKTGKLLSDLYTADQDRDTRRAVISALSNQNNAEGLVAIARKENDLELKRDIVKRLSDMAPKNKVAADFLLEMIK